MAMPSILIVEDDAMMREMLKDILAPLGATVVEVSDGDAAMTALRRQTFGLVLLDLMMPKKSGLELLREHRGQWGKTRVLVVSSLDTDSLVDQALADGAHGFIAKPFHALEVQTAVRNELEQYDGE